MRHLYGVLKAALYMVPYAMIGLLATAMIRGCIMSGPDKIHEDAIDEAMNTSISHCEPDGAIRDIATIKKYGTLRNIFERIDTGAFNSLKRQNVAVCFGGQEQTPVVATFSKAAGGYKISIPESANGVRWATTLIQQAANHDLSKYSTGKANRTEFWNKHSGRDEKLERAEWTFE